MPLYSSFRVPKLMWKVCHGIEVLARAYLFSSPNIFVSVCVAQLERFVDDTTFQKSNSPPRSKSSTKHRSGSLGSAATVVGLDSSSGLTVDYRLVQTLTDEQDSYLS
jgi:hypothetical protein